MDFPGSPVTKTSCFQCNGPVRELDPTCFTQDATTKTWPSHINFFKKDERKKNVNQIKLMKSLFVKRLTQRLHLLGHIHGLTKRRSLTHASIFINFAY